MIKFYLSGLNTDYEINNEPPPLTLVGKFALLGKKEHFLFLFSKVKTFRGRGSGSKIILLPL